MKKTNVIFILVDDMGYGDFGVFGDGSAKTPNLDRLISQGTCLSNHYSASPVCAPARAALMTGRYPHRTGTIDTLEAIGLDRMSSKEVTIGDVFKANGYRTGLIGKWHLGAGDDKYHPNNRGFDEFIGFRGGWEYYYDWTIEYNGKDRHGKGEYLTHVFTEEALGFIERHREEPFFLHLAYNAPHFPFEAPEEYIKPFRETGKFNERLSTLYGMIACMDEGIGQILEALKKYDLEEDTLLIFTSDNGPQLNDGVERYNCDLNGQKGLTYEGGIRVPAIVRWPGRVVDDLIIEDFFHGCDWFPTLLSACNLELPEDIRLDGKDMLPSLLGDSSPYGLQRCWQWNRYEPVVHSNSAIRDGKWKLLRRPIAEAMEMTEADIIGDTAFKKNMDKDKKITPYVMHDRKLSEPHEPELYNIEEDPLELKDLSGDYPDIVSRLNRDFESWFEEVEAEREINKEY